MGGGPGGWGDFSTTSSTLGYSTTTLSTTTFAPSPIYSQNESTGLESVLALVIGVPIVLLLCCIGCGAGCGILCYRQCRKKKQNAQQLPPQVVVVNPPMQSMANPQPDPQPDPPPYESLQNPRESGQYWEISDAEAARQAAAPCPRPADNRTHTYLELTAVSPPEEMAHTSADYLKPVQHNSSTDPQKAYDYVVSKESENGKGTADEGYLAPVNSYDDNIVQAKVPQKNVGDQIETSEAYLKPVQCNSRTDPEKDYDYVVSKENQNGKGTVDEGYLAPENSYDDNALPTLGTDKNVAPIHQNLFRNTPVGYIPSVQDQNRGHEIPTEVYRDANPQLVVDHMQGSGGSLDPIHNPTSAAPVSHQDGYLAPVGRNCSDPEGYSYAIMGQQAQDERAPSPRPAGVLSSAQDYLDMNKPPPENPHGHYRNEALMHGQGKKQEPGQPVSYYTNPDGEHETRVLLHNTNGQ